MTPLESARSKLTNPELGVLTPVEIVALLGASNSQAAPRKPTMVPALIEDILDATLGQDRDTARANLARIFKEKDVSVAIVKTWGDDDAFNSIKTGS